MTTAQTTTGTDGKIRILIVDDEPMLRSVIQDFLLMLGFEEQFVASDGMEALEVIRANTIDCMLSDIRMPKMELEELLGVIQKEFPKLIVVATSGYSDLASARNIFNKGAHDFLGKPLNLDALELALQWITERRKVLLLANHLFGQPVLPIPPSEAESRIDELIEALVGGIHHFQSKIRHAVRIANLARRLQTDLEAEANLDLRTAILLHELGTGYQIQTLCRQPRRLDDEERRLVQEHARITGRLVAHSLDRPDFNTIIGRHLGWQTLPPQRDGGSNAEYIALWLGILNAIDGYLHDRPDRPGVSTLQMKDMLAKKVKKQPLAPIAALLDQWDKVEGYYVAPSAS